MARLTLGLLGSLQARVGHTAITADFESDKTRALLAYLAVEAQQPHRRGALTGLLWPESPEEVARRNLRQALYDLRQTIRDHSANPPYLLISRDEIQFNLASDHTLDVATFDALLAATRAHQHQALENCPACAARLQQAVGLYRGKFLQEFFLEDSAEFEEWAVQQREALHRRALEALEHLASYHEQRGEPEEALQAARRQLELDPWREGAHRQVMRVLTAKGERGAALAQYETCRRILIKELGVEPSPETRALYDEIKSAEGRAAAVSSLSAHTPPPVAPHDLPIPLTPFVGREWELGQLALLLADPQCRLLTLVGPGGIGKTRLALQAAASQRQAFAQGAAFVPLVSVPSAEWVSPAIAEAVRFSPNGANDPKLQLLNFLAGKEMLLVLDNVEHLLEGADLFVEILQRAPRVKLLVTSREPLSVQGEWVLEVKGLAVPDSEQAEGFEDYSAVSLFLERAHRARLGFTLQDAGRAAVGRICRRLEGMPLGLELAASWVRVLSCAEIAEQIEQNFDFLATSLRDVPERHKSLRAVLDQSWSMLTPQERQVTSRLSVFSGGFEREAAERVAGASLSLLASLVAKSLVRRVEGDRYDLHELVRQYARARLLESNEAETACAGHLRYFIELAEEAERELHGAAQLAWLDRLEKEHDNLRAALEWSLTWKPEGALSSEAKARAVEEGLELASALYFFWRRRSHWSEGRDWVKRALARSAALPPSRARSKALNVAVLLALEQADTREARDLSEENRLLAAELGDSHRIACALNSHGILLWKQKDYAAARACCEEALAIFRELGDRTAIADALHYLGHVAINQDDYAAAQAFLDETVALCRELNDKIGVDDGLGDLGRLAYLRNDYAAARAYLMESLAGFREAASVPGAVAALNRLGDLARCRGDYQEAEKFYSESLALYRDLGDKDEIPSLLHNSGYVALRRGDCSQALALFREALAIQRETSNRAGIAECLAGIAGVLTSEGKAEEAARLFGAAEALREVSGAAVWPANRLEYERSAALLKQALGKGRLAKLSQEGREMTVEAAIARATVEDPARPA